MAFKLVEALYDDMGLPWPEHLLELVALGTVADVGPLTGENRFFVKKGLEKLNKTQNVGIRALAESARLKFGSLDTESLSFGLIPRLNVAGRLGCFTRLSGELPPAELVEMLDEIFSAYMCHRLLSSASCERIAVCVAGPVEELREYSERHLYRGHLLTLNGRQLLLL